VPLESGAVNEQARGVVADLSRSLLDQPAPQAAPVVAPPILSLGPEAVDDQVRAEEVRVHVNTMLMYDVK
jgi:hypothetical protein